MKLHPPMPHQPVGQRNMFTPWWMSWLRQLYESMGWNYQAPVYGDMPLTLVAHGPVATFDGELLCPSFESGSSHQSTLLGYLPNNWAIGTDLSPYMEWMPTDAVGGIMVANFGYSVAGNGEVFASETEETSNETVTATQYLSSRTEFTDIDGSALNPGDVFLLKFGRDGADADDTYANTILGVRFGVKIRIKGVGYEQAHP